MTKSFVIASIAAALVDTSSASAQTYPSRPITVLSGFAAGGPTDVVMRILADRMRTTLGQQIVIENATGASGSIAVGRVVRSPADGHTLSIGHWSTHVVNGAIYPLPYDMLTDLAPIALLPSNPMIVVSKKAAPASNLKELIAWLKANPNRVSAGTAGPGSGTHVAGVYFQRLTDTQFTFIPYRGTGPAIQDLMAGQIDLIVDQAANSLPQVRNGTIRAYAVTAKQRLASAPEIPTVDESGLPGLHVSTWYGLWAPKNTSRAVIERLSAATIDALADPTVRQRFGDLGLEIPARDQQTPEALSAFHKAEIEKWWPIIKAANIRGE
ncbi:MAG: tripartite tricarboxylate transporter substrate binding protein BugD [Xanthobacteraceae bacterium]|nr:tripartite tricarboxylate transporter substrate binding protein BugD [Xanthobacteraceae bacterium]